MMKKTTNILWTLFLLTSLSACQQVPIPTTGGGNGDTGETTITVGGLEPCTGEDAGTLDCYVTGAGSDTDVSIFDDPTSAYETCMENCLNSLGCGVSPFSIANAEATCSEAQFSSCSSQCEVTQDSGLSTLAPGTGLTIPQPAKVIEVKMSTCLDERTNFFQFKGPSMGTRKFHHDKYTAKWNGKLSISGFKVETRMPSQVSANPGCPSSRKGVIPVTFTPYKSPEPYNYAGTDYDVVPFSGAVADTINQTWYAPHLTAMKLPKELYSELDLSQATWFVKSLDTANPIVQHGIPLYNHGWVGYDIGEGYADTILGIAPMFSDYQGIDFTVVAFVKSLEP